MPTQAKTEQKRVRASADDLPSRALPERLLYTRKQAAELLGGISGASMKRFEEQGVLKPLRLNKRSVTGQVFYRHSNLMAVARGGGDDDDA
jgi:hypothetical protein